LARADFRLVPLPINLSAVEVSSAVPLAVDTRTGNQIFKQNDYHGAPTNTTSQILQQSIVGAARAPTGEVHIRGQHAEYTYYVDGVPVPAGISGSLNELFDPQVVNQIDFQTGGWDAEYGNKNAAVVNVTTRIPSGGFHVDASGYGGSLSANGQTLNLSTNAGKVGLFFSGARQGTNMRREPVALKLDYTLQPHHGLEFKTGVLASLTRGHEDFSVVTSTGNPGPASNSDLKGSDVGVYAQTAIAPSDKWELRTGVRFDNHNAPFAGNQHQVSPRVKLSFFPDPGNTFWVYYGRLFLPTNVEDLL